MAEKRPRIDAQQSAFNKVEGTGRKYGLGTSESYGAALEYVEANLDEFESFLESRGNSKYEQGDDRPSTEQ